MPLRLRRFEIGPSVIVLCAVLFPAGAACPRAASQPSLHQAVADAWARMPQRNTFAAQGNMAAARTLAGSALLPNAPTATGSYVDDRQIGSHYDYVTSQIQLSTPVWLPGEGRATQAAGRAEAAAVEAQAAMAHLSLAARVLALAKDATDAADARALAARRLATAQTLAADLARSFAVGESAQTDALAADGEASTATIDLASAEARLAAARVALATVTGTPAVPLLTVPAGPMLVGNAEHPEIAAARRQVEAAQAQERLVYIQDRDDPELGVEGINEKQPGTRWDTRVGVTVTFHFATEARNAPRRAAAAEQVTRAAVQLELTRRSVAAAVQQARVLVASAARAQAAADRGAAALAQRRGQIERAWRLGEMPFIELVRANALAFDAEAARDRARTAQAASAWQLRIAQGDLP